MDLINNLIFTALNSTQRTPSTATKAIDPGFSVLSPDLVSGLQPVKLGTSNFYAYPISYKEDFCSLDDSSFIDKSIQKHWTDLVYGRNYSEITGDDLPGGTYYTAFRTPGQDTLIPPHHLIFAYLVENTRMAQIFQKVIYLYMNDEKLNKASGTTSVNRLAFQWMLNTENLFFKELSNNSYRNIDSRLRSNPEAVRRNAYYRMFGMDLAFGDWDSNNSVPYFKAEFNNQPFIILFEAFLTEIWQAYTNAKNTSGANSTDMFTIVDTAQKIQEMLMSRRTTETNLNNYRYFNLSKEEFSSVVMMSWLFEVVSYDSPLIQFLRCNGVTPGERLINIGNKVGLPAHSKSEGLLDIAPVMNTLLRRIELGDYNNSDPVRNIIISQTITTSTDDDRQAMDNLLLIINNWEKATGHRIKNPQAAVQSNIRLAQPHSNGSTKMPTGKPVVANAKPVASDN